VALAAAALIAAAVTARAQTPEQCSRAQVLSGQRGTWMVLPGPTFPSGGKEMTAHTIDGRSPLWHFATNGSVVMRSLDGACTWTEVYRAPTIGSIKRLAADDGVVVASLTLPGSAQLPDVATLVVSSTDAGLSFRTSTVPLPGIPGDIEVKKGGLVWIAAGNVLFRSVDGGATFTPTAPVGDVTSIEHVGAPVVGGEGVVWAKGADGPAFRSTDGGATWRRYPELAAFAGPAMEAFDDAHRKLRLTFVASNEESGAIRGLMRSIDNGESFEPLDASAVESVEGRLESFDDEQRRGELVMSTEDPAGAHGAYVWQAKRNRLVPIDEFALGPLRGAQAEDIYRERPRFHFFDDDEVFRYETPAGGTNAIPLPGGPDYENPDPRPASLEPGGGEIRVPAGGSRKVAYRLTLPERSARLDTFFVLDTSNSTDGYINGLRVGVSRIARSLATAGVEARFGVGEYQDHAAPGYVRYARRADIGPADRLRSALAKMKPAGGEEPGYTAVHEAVTGRGIPQPKTGAPVEPGQSAHWRAKALRTLVLIADESFATDPEGPTPRTTAAALKKSGAAFVGVAVTDPGATPLDPGEEPRCADVIGRPAFSSGGSLGTARLRCQLEDLARAAGTLAPSGGADCDGDGRTDVPAGRPLVCVISGERSQGVVAVAAPLRRLLLAVTEEQPVELRPAGKPAPEVEIDPGGDFTRLDLKQPHELQFLATFGCPRELAGRRLRVRLKATTGGREVAEATPTVVCGEQAKPAPAAVIARKAKPVVAKPAKVPPAPQPAPPAPAPAPAPPAPAPAAQVVPVPPPATLPPPATAPASAPAPAQASAPAVAAAERRAEAGAFERVHVHEEPGDLQFTGGDPWPARLVAVGGLFLATALWPAAPARSAPRTAPVTAASPSATHRRRRRRRPRP
jgi:outer membrane biosynthesis protein TonB